MILSAEESAGLFAWLEQNGFSLGESSRALLQEYIDAGAYFFVARVALDAQVDGQVWLPPLRFSYTSDAVTLPIRLGTLSSSGQQDLFGLRRRSRPA